MKRMSLDTETTGFDFAFGASVFYVNAYANTGDLTSYRWKVDPYTRRVVPPRSDIKGLQKLVDSADSIIFHNSKFDIKALSYIGVIVPWSKVEDTLVAGHLLASNQPHNLTDMAAHYLGISIAGYEASLKQACMKARNLARNKYPDWAIAKEGREDMPSAGKEPWKADMWLPAQLAEEEGYGEDHEWYRVMEDYADADPYTTYQLWDAVEAELHKKGLWKLYRESMRLPPVLQSMEEYGVTVNRHRFAELQNEYLEESERLSRVCMNIAAKRGFDLKLPKSGNNDSLIEFLFGPPREFEGADGKVVKEKTIRQHSPKCLNLAPVKRTDTGAPSLDAECLEVYSDTLPQGSPELTFIKSLWAKRKRDTAIGYMNNYEKYCIPLDEHAKDGWHRIRPNLNQTGTTTTRSSSSNPNEQSISKKQDFNLRYGFGPAPGRVWLSADANNLEMVIPAFEAGEEELIHLFTHPQDGPYYGSYHLMIFDTLHPVLFAKHGTKVKDIFKATWYKWVKNGNFAKLYGGQPRTVNRAYHVENGYELVDRRLPRIAALNEHMINTAQRTGYVETIPDKSVDPTRGYPLMCTFTEWQKALPTVPLNYHVQGTGGWWKRKAMVRVHEFFQFLNTGGRFGGKTWPGGYYLIMDIHDELVMDMPQPAGKGLDYNHPIALKIKQLMELGGQDIGIPITVSAEFHPVSWDAGIPLAV